MTSIYYTRLFHYRLEVNFGMYLCHKDDFRCIVIDQILMIPRYTHICMNKKLLEQVWTDL